MKMRNLLTICGVAAALMLSAGTIFAQIGNGGGNGGGGNGGGFGNGGGGGGGGGRQRGGGGFGGGQGGNFDPAQMLQRQVQSYQDQLGFTNDADWSAVEPLVQKVVEARNATGNGFGRGGFGGGRQRGGQNGQQGGQQGGRRGNFGQQPDPTADALQNALDDNAPASQIKDLLAKYKASQKDKQSKLTAARSDLRKVLTVRQEAEATLLGLLD